MGNKNDMTKAELVSAIQRKLKRASPILRRTVLSRTSLMRLSKKELHRRLTKGHVVRRGEFKGDISYM